jgi:hypothetical protein
MREKHSRCFAIPGFFGKAASFKTDNGHGVLCRARVPEIVTPLIATPE